MDVRKLWGLVAQDQPSGPLSEHDGDVCEQGGLQMRPGMKRRRYLSNGRTSEPAVGSPLELGNSFLFGGTDGAPERGYALTTATSVGLHGAQQRRR